MGRLGDWLKSLKTWQKIAIGIALLALIIVFPDILIALAILTFISIPFFFIAILISENFRTRLAESFSRLPGITKEQGAFVTALIVSGYLFLAALGSSLVWSTMQARRPEQVAQQSTTTTTERRRARERQTTTTQRPTTTTERPTTTTTQISRQQQQNDYLIFEDQFIATFQPALDALKNFNDVNERLGQGATIDEAIQAAQTLKQESRNVANAYLALDVPDSLPTNVQDILEQAKTNSSNSFFELAGAADADVRFLEAPSGSSEEDVAIQDEENHLNESKRLFDAAMNNLNSARQDLGLPTISLPEKLKFQGLFKSDWISIPKQVKEKSKLKNKVH